MLMTNWALETSTAASNQFPGTRVIDSSQGRPTATTQKTTELLTARIARQAPTYGGILS